MNLNKHLQKILCSHVITKLGFGFSLENVGMADHYYNNNNNNNNTYL